MTAIGDMPVTQVMDYKRSKLVRPFCFMSDVLEKEGLQFICKIPTGFANGLGISSIYKRHVKSIWPDP